MKQFKDYWFDTEIEARDFIYGIELSDEIEATYLNKCSETDSYCVTVVYKDNTVRQEVNTPNIFT